MRLGIMCHSNLGGSSRIAGELALELSRRGHRVHLFSRTLPGAAGDFNGHVALHLVYPGPAAVSPFSGLAVEWPSWEVEALLDRVAGVIDREGLDLLHFHYALPFAAIAVGLRHRLGPAAPLLVGTLHGTDVSIYGRHPVTGPQLAQTLRYVDGLTTVSVSHARLAAQVFGLPELPVVIPNFIDLSRFRPVPWPPDSGNSRRPRIVHISNFRPVKNPRGLARIFLGILPRMAAELWLVGDGPEAGWLKTCFQEQGLQRHVRFLGAQRQVAPILSQADLLLMPSLAESFCLAALEAMACGVPVLATRVGGLPEVVVHGKTGLLFPPGEPLTAVDLAVQLLSDPVRRRAMREAALSRARGYEQTEIISLYEDYYQNLLARRRPRRLRPVRPAAAVAGHYFPKAHVLAPEAPLPAWGPNHALAWRHEEKDEPL
jgi:N-acetyl-alpha-D-glucosaminyl L-malate synthase BshA